MPESRDPSPYLPEVQAKSRTLEVTTRKCPGCRGEFVLETARREANRHGSIGMIRCPWCRHDWVELPPSKEELPPAVSATPPAEPARTLALHHLPNELRARFIVLRRLRELYRRELAQIRTAAGDMRSGGEVTREIYEFAEALLDDEYKRVQESSVAEFLAGFEHKQS